MLIRSLLLLVVSIILTSCGSGDKSLQTNTSKLGSLNIKERIPPTFDTSRPDVGFLKVGSLALIDIEKRTINFGNITRFEWYAVYENYTNNEVSATLQICDSTNAYVEHVATNTKYLVDCEDINIRALPKTENWKSKFATSNISTKNIRNDSKVTLCLEGIGCNQY